MNDELKALLEEAYNRGASKSDLDQIVDRYNQKKKEPSEASVSQPLEKPSASVTSPSFIPEDKKPVAREVPAAFAEIPKIEPREVKKEQQPPKEATVKDWWGDKWNGLIEGIETFASNVRDENNMNGVAIASFIEDNKSNKPELFGIYTENLESLVSRG